MFTGIIEVLGTVREVTEGKGLRRVLIETDPAFLSEVRPGASIAVDGACLTPIEIEGDSFLVEAVGTTLSKTVAARYAAGSRVNLERAMILGERLDGHLVQGHVDGVGTVRSIRDDGDYRVLEVVLPGDIHRMTLLHGSITLNGVSLTVSRLLEGDAIEVAIIPHTWQHTNLSGLGPGSPVNVEGDLIGKYVGKLLHTEQTEGGSE